MSNEDQLKAVEEFIRQGAENAKQHTETERAELEAEQKRCPEYYDPTKHTDKLKAVFGKSS